MDVFSTEMHVLLRDDQERPLIEAGFSNVDFYGDYDFRDYDKGPGLRLIAVAQKWCRIVEKQQPLTRGLQFRPSTCADTLTDQIMVYPVLAEGARFEPDAVSTSCTIQNKRADSVDAGSTKMCGSASRSKQPGS